jgi:hypothetical protein
VLFKGNRSHLSIVSAWSAPDALGVHAACPLAGAGG